MEEPNTEPIEIEEVTESSIAIGDIQLTACIPITELGDLMIILLRQKEILDYLDIIKLKKKTSGATYCD